MINYICLDNTDSYAFNNAEREFFVSETNSLEKCVNNNYNGFIVYNDTVYYRNIDFEDLVKKYVYNENSKLYLIVPDKYINKIETINNRVKYYTSNIFNNVIQLDNSGEKLNINTLKKKLKNMDNNKWIYRHYNNLYKYLIKNDNLKTKYFKINPFDISWGLDEPTFTKARPKINGGKNILLPLEDIYKPYTVYNRICNDIPFENKKNSIIWRGCNSGFFNERNNRAMRGELVEKYYNHNIFDIGYCDMRYENDKYIYKIDKKKICKNYVNITDQLKYKFILSVEGNDFATNLGWILLSNSIPICPVHFIETWNMETKLIPWKHYVPVLNDFSDLSNNYNKIVANKKLCNTILFEKKLFMSQFLDITKENYIINKVIDKYLENTTNFKKI